MNREPIKFPAWCSRAAHIVDLSDWAHRAWHAVAPTTLAPNGEPVHMIHGVAQMLVRLLAGRDPRWLVAAADLGGTTWRHELFPAYKANRPPHPEGFDRQVAEVVRLLELHRVPVLGAPGFDADDVIATLVRRFRACGLDVVIVGRDKDLKQLVTSTPPCVGLWDGKDKLVGPHAVRDEWNIEPASVGDLLALVGDKGDGIPGVPGVGPVTAAKILHRDGSLEAALTKARAWWKPEGIDRAIAEHADQIRLARRLVTLRDDVPLQVDLGACALGGYDAAGLHAFCEAAGLPRLAERLEGATAAKARVSAEMVATWRASA